MDKTELDNKAFKPHKEVKVEKKLKVFSTPIEAAKALNVTSDAAIKKAKDGVISISGVKPLKKDN